MELVKIRASQMNGCAYCIDMHTKEARAPGETEQRMYLAAGTSGSGVDQAITNIADGHAPAAVYEEALREFDEAQLTKPTMAGIYQPRPAKAD